MSWPASFAVALLAAVLGGALAFVLAERCAEWYSVSNFEGGRGYFMAFLTLFGIIVGFLAGLIISRVVAGGAHPGFLAALGRTAATLVGVAAVIGGLARLNAHVGPTLDRESLQLVVEVRMPPGWTPNNRARSGDNLVALTALAPGKRMASHGGSVRWSDARVEDGRWTVPAEVSLFTTRGMRLVDLHVGGQYVGIVVPIPARPSAEHLTWSAWRADGFTRPVDGPPATGFAYRFRVAKWSEANARTAAEEAERAAATERAYAALTPESPLEAWVRFADYGAAADRRTRAYEVLVARFGEFPTLVAMSDAARLVQAAYALDNLPTMPAGGRETMREMGRALAPRLARWIAENPDGDCDVPQAKGLENVVRSWIERWKREWPDAVAEIRPELEAIAAQAAPRQDAAPMREILALARNEIEELDAPGTRYRAPSPADQWEPARD